MDSAPRRSPCTRCLRPYTPGRTDAVGRCADCDELAALRSRVRGLEASRRVDLRELARIATARDEARQLAADALRVGLECCEELRDRLWFVESDRDDAHTWHHGLGTALHEAWRWVTYAREEIAALRTDVATHEWCERERDAATAALAACRAARADLRTLLAHAPHLGRCGTHDGRYCDCWLGDTRRGLEAIEHALAGKERG